MPERTTRFPHSAVALLLQLAAVASMFLIVRLSGLHLSMLAFAGCCGLLAAALAYFAKLPGWWWLIQALFVPAVAATLALDVQPGYFLVAFLILWLVYWNAFRTRVPLYLSSKQAWRALEQLLPPPAAHKRFQFVDLGCGLGGVLAHLAQVRPDGDYVGIESAPLPWLWAWLRIRLGGQRHCRVRWDDFWGCDLSDFDVVYAYLSPAPMARLWAKVQAEMKPGSVFISSTFAVPGQTPDETVEIDDLHRSTLFIWRM